MLKLISTILLSFLIITGDLPAQDVKITPLPFNSRGSEELFPCFIDSSLIFVSNRRTTVFKNYEDEQNNNLYHLFIVKLRPDSSWTKPKIFNSVLNGVFNNGQMWFADNGNTVYLTRNNYNTYKQSKKNRTGNGISIFVAKKNAAGKWGQPKPLPFTSQSNYNTGQPTLSPDGKYLFFVSDMNNGYGKTDIFYSENVNGTWSDPVNMGNKINTPGTEVTPYCHPSGKLYFSSDGLGGSGGLDIFYTIKTKDGWITPVNIGEPYNSAGDDFSYYIAAPDDFGFFASNRSGETDLYRADPQYPHFDSIVPQKELKYCGTLFERKMMAKDTARFDFTWDMGDGTIEKGKKIQHCFPKPGKYHVVLTVTDKKGLIAEAYKTSYDLNIKPKKQIYISSPDTVRINTAITFDTKLSFFGDFQPGTFYWNFGDGFKTKGEKVTYTFRKPGVYTISCGTVSVTDPDEKMCNSRKIVVTE